MGKAVVVDGDSLNLATSDETVIRIRLDGIDAPELDQICGGREGDALAEYECGVITRDLMKSWAEGKIVICSVVAKEVHGRSLSRCRTDTIRDLGEALVAFGFAVATDRQYKPMEEKARKSRLGIWLSSFVKPEDWRKRKK